LAGFAGVAGFAPLVFFSSALSFLSRSALKKPLELP
jgi:hypothetical protein